ncbi:PRC-barrel domain-containing protein [Legionella beliardensis]|uniref:PRC-barrel domain-containing protein n=1 Tax=Legionella beliardensis TaxID=91822 RepID=A0A378HZF7_9GAMM|nr:PRC-barrel domain-containing protein [Legionella beliardensis]STX27891.1 PRC-barrel domain-containing protein [Legionella beliardensis]
MIENHSEDVVRTEDVIGKEVKSPTLDDLGTIEEIVLDKFTGQTRYVVLSFGGFMGMGDDYFAFPWKSISYNKEEECFILNIDKEKLQRAHGFNKDHWPDMSQWPNTVDNLYAQH